MRLQKIMYLQNDDKRAEKRVYKKVDESEFTGFGVYSADGVGVTPGRNIKICRESQQAGRGDDQGHVEYEDGLRA